MIFLNDINVEDVICSMEVFFYVSFIVVLGFVCEVLVK